MVKSISVEDELVKLRSEFDKCLLAHSKEQAKVIRCKAAGLRHKNKLGIIAEKASKISRRIKSLTGNKE